MTENYIFSGIGQATGRYNVSNKDIKEAIDKGLLSGFDESKILHSKNYQNFLITHPGTSAFDYFASYKMGFENRSYVSPFPPRKKHFALTETSTDLAVRAIEDAFNDGRINPEDIDAWFLSTVSPHEQAPGIAATVKAHFVNINNNTPTYSLASGCSGFNLNLERAIEYLKQNENAKNVVVCHTETMSSFLTEKSLFVSFVTFGDAAGAVVLSKTYGEKPEGVIAIENHQDLKMVDFVGVDSKWNLYMDESVIKQRAVENIVKSTKSILNKTNYTIDDIDIFVPHQTGNAILLEAGVKLNIKPQKLYLDVQRRFGNVSGATVALSLSMLNKELRLFKGQKILSSAAGVGGKYGSFIYLVPKKQQNTTIKHNPLKNKTALIVGATGLIGQHIAVELAEKSCNLILHYRNEQKKQELKNLLEKYDVKTDFIKFDLFDNDEIKNALKNIENINYLVLSSGVSGGLASVIDNEISDYEYVNQVNFISQTVIVSNLLHKIKESILYLGSAAEDAQFQGSSAYVAAKKALHGYAASISGEAFSKNIRSVYFMPGVVDGGMTNQLNEKQIFKAMQAINQSQIIHPKVLADKVVKSLYLLKITEVKESFENMLTVRRFRYFI